MKTPVWPDNFKQLFSEGASYWWWSNETGPDYDGTWPIHRDPPKGLMVTCAEAEDPSEWVGETVTVSWEYGPDTESGPWLEKICEDTGTIQSMVDEVLRQVVEEQECVKTSV